MGLTPLAFTGVSQYSTDLQQVLQRAVNIAALPIRALQNDQTALLGRKTALANLQGSVDSLAASVRALGEVGDERAAAASSNNSSVVTAEVTGDAPDGTYSFTSVTRIAETAIAATVLTYASVDATEVAGAGNYLELRVNGTAYEFNLTDAQDNLESIRDLINASAAGLDATIINTGSGYALSVSGRETGVKTIGLWTGAGGTGSNLLAEVDPGADAEFVLNGQTITSASNTFDDVIPGVTFTLQGATGVGETARVTVASNRGSLNLALQGFVAAYNGLRQAADAQSVASDGILGGSSVVREIQRQMQSIAAAQGAGSIASLADLGLTFDDDGVLSMDYSRIDALSATELSSAFEFLGTAGSGLGTLAAGLDAITDPIDGMIQWEQESIDAADERIGKQVAQMTERLEGLQRDMFQRLQAADALLSRLENQQGLLTASLASLNFMLYGRQEGY